MAFTRVAAAVSLTALLLFAGACSRSDTEPAAEKTSGAAGRKSRPSNKISKAELTKIVRQLLKNPPQVAAPIQHLIALQILTQTDPAMLRTVLTEVASELQQAKKIRTPEAYAADLHSRQLVALYGVLAVDAKLVKSDPSFRKRIAASFTFAANGDFLQPRRIKSADGKWLPTSREFPNAKGLHTLVVHLERGKRKLDARAAALRAADPDAGDAQQLQAELQQVLDNRKKLDEALTKIAAETRAAWQEAQSRSSIIRRDLKEMSDDVDPAANITGDKETVAFLHDRLYSGKSPGDQLKLLEKNEGAFGKMNESQKQNARKILNTQVRNRRLNRLQKGSDAVEAFGHGAKLLHDMKLIGPKEYENLQKGVQAANYALEVASAFVTKNPFAAISGTIQFFNVLLGNDPPPDPAVVRHEQVMDMLNHIAKGQQQIFDAIVRLSDQINRQYVQLHGELDAIHKIVINTQKLIVEHQIRGLDRAQWFIENRQAHNGGRGPESVSVRDFSSYDALRNHFFDNSNEKTGKDFYQQAIRFLDDQTKGKPTALLQYATRDEELKNAADAVNQRMEKLRAFIRKYVKEEYQPALIGSLIHPANSYDAINAKVDRILNHKADSTARHWKTAYARLDLLQTIGEYYDPGLVAQIVKARIELQPYSSLLDRNSGKLLKYETLTGQDFQPLPAYSGDMYADRFRQHVKPLQDSRRLIGKSVAQQALLSGDALIPIFAQIVVSIRGEMNIDHAILDDVREILAENPVIYQNAVRYQVYSHLNPDGDGKVDEPLANWNRVFRLLKKKGANFPADPPGKFLAMPKSKRDAYWSLVEIPASQTPPAGVNGKFVTARSEKRKRFSAREKARKKYAMAAAKSKRAAGRVAKSLRSVKYLLAYKAAKTAAAAAKKAYDQANGAYVRANRNYVIWESRSRAYRDLCDALDVLPNQIVHPPVPGQSKAPKRGMFTFVLSKNPKQKYFTPLPDREVVDSLKFQQSDSLWMLLVTERGLNDALTETTITFAPNNLPSTANLQFRRERLLRTLYRVTVQ